MATENADLIEATIYEFNTYLSKTIFIKKKISFYKRYY